MTLNIEYDQVLKLASQLSYRDKKKLTRAMQKDIKEKEKKAAAANGDQNLSDLQRLLLQGPVMTDEQFNNFKAVRKNFNKWIEK